MTSTYTDYNQTSRNYDRTRWAAGVEIILGCVAHSQNSLDEVCGQIRQMARDGELTQFVERHSAPVRAVGQFTFLYATSGRPPAE